MSLDLILPSYNQRPFLETYDPAPGDETSQIFTAQVIYTSNLPILSKKFRSATVKWWVVAAAGNLDVAIMTTPDAGVTFERVQSTGAVAVAGTNAGQSNAFAFDFEPGIEYHVAVLSDGTPTLGCVKQGGTNGLNHLNFGYVVAQTKAAVGTTIPASVTTLTNLQLKFWFRFCA